MIKKEHMLCKKKVVTKNKKSLAVKSCINNNQLNSTRYGLTDEIGGW